MAVIIQVIMNTIDAVYSFKYLSDGITSNDDTQY